MAIFLIELTSDDDLFPSANFPDIPSGDSIEVIGLAGNDTVNGTSLNDLILGNEDNDSLTGNTGDDTLYGGKGDDIVADFFGNNLLQGNIGADIITSGTGDDTVYGGQDNDTISSDGGNNLILGNLGDDSITVGAGADTVYGGQGADTISGGEGNNLLLGNLDDDIITGGTGADTVYGGQGADTITGAGGIDNIIAGKGDDEIVLNADDAIAGEILNGGDGTDKLSILGNNNISGASLVGIEAISIANGQTLTTTLAQVDANSTIATISVSVETKKAVLKINDTTENILASNIFTKVTEGITIQNINGEIVIKTESTGTNLIGGEPLTVNLPALALAAPSPNTDDGSIIDVMVVYTTELRQAWGGLQKVNELIEQAVNDVNTAFTNSGVNPRLRLVHAAEVNYQESGIANTDLNKLTTKNDGSMDEIHQLRDQYGADLVSLFVNNLDWGGLAWKPDSVSNASKDTAFSVVKGGPNSFNNAIAPWNAFAHELGHNLGLHHDQVTAGGGASSHPYAYGYITPSGIGDVMSYSQNKIEYFSNPNITYQGEAIGNSQTADAARAINENAFAVANYKPSQGSTEPTTPTVTISAINSNASEDGDAGQVVIYRTGDASQALTVNYAVSGTATNGIDYIDSQTNNGFSGSATILAGVDSITLSVKPIKDADIEGDENAVFEISSSSNYDIGNNSQATVTIADSTGSGNSDTIDTYFFTYASGTGDEYFGYVYDYSGSYAVGDTIDPFPYLNEWGYEGYYTISDIQNNTGTVDQVNSVYVTEYYDRDYSGNTYVPYYYNEGYASGYDGLGSEVDFIYSDGFGYDDFGYDYYEADAQDITGTTDSVDLYYFTYIEGSGDEYYGYFYDYSQTYNTGDTLNPYATSNEWGYDGYYYIDGVQPNVGTIDDLGAVYITEYYDGDYSGEFYTPYYYSQGYTSGYDGLGSEVDFIYSNFFGYDDFGYDYYTADGFN